MCIRDRKSKATNKLNDVLNDYSTLEKARWSFGKVIDAATKEELIGANIIIQGTNIGTASDLNGNFILKGEQKPPYNLSISYTGYSDKIIQVTTENQANLEITLTSGGVLLDQVVVGASRHSERFVEAPVTVEKLDILALQSSSAEGVFCLLYTSPSPRDATLSRMPSSA